MGVDETLLNEVIRRVLTVARPDRIILFGSTATGQMTKDSDIDLLVVEPEPANTRDRSIRIRRALGDVEYPVDVIVMSSERFEETKNIIGGIAYPAQKYGRASMKPPDVALRGLVLQWLDKVAADFDAAEQLCAMGGRFREIIAFLCQQRLRSI